MKNIYLLLLVVVLLSGCADHVTLAEAMYHEKVGFLHGFLHGVILIPAWIISIFDSDVAIYAIYNNGGWYDFGFVLGAFRPFGYLLSRFKQKEHKPMSIAETLTHRNNYK